MTAVAIDPRPVKAALQASSDTLAALRLDATRLDGQQRARIKRVCDNLVDSEDELLYLVHAAPELREVVDQVVGLIVKLTPIAYAKVADATPAEPGSSG